MYNVQSLSGLPSQIKVNNNKGSPQKEEKINKKKMEEQRGEGWSGVDGWIYAFTRSNAGSHPCPPHN
jgi:hypothetical protein